MEEEIFNEEYTGIYRLEDWAKYPKAIVHENTSNQSFLHVARLYKAMGIKNHAFLLALHNPDLEFVDPFDPNLTLDEKEMIAEEVAENPWYFFREILRIPAKGTVEGIRFQANRGNIAFIWLFMQHITTMIIMPRQTGKSVVADSTNVYLLIAGGSNIATLIVTKDNNLRVSNIERLKGMFELLPAFLNLRTKQDSNNTENITINALNNRLDTAVGQNTEAGAAKVGRGLTVPVINFDEAPFIPHLKTTLQSAIPATAAARESARAAGAPYCITYTTTPGYLNTESGRTAKGIYDNCARWIEPMLDCDSPQSLKEMITKNSRGGKYQVLVEMNHRQLGKTDKWLKERIEQMQADENDADDVEANYMNKWPSGSAASPLSKEALEKIKKSVTDQYITDISTEGYIVNWYLTEYELMRVSERKIVLGMDSSEMVNEDFTALVGRDVITGAVVCTANVNETNIITFSNFLANFLIKYPNITPEAKSTGLPIIDNVALIMLSKGYNPFKRIYNKVVEDPDNEDLKNILADRYLEPLYTKYRKEFGYRTTGAGRNARDNLYGSAFNASIKYTGHLIKDANIVNDISGLVIKNGRIDHQVGCHDDAVISWMLSYFFLTSALNKEAYGVDTSEALRGVKMTLIDEQGGPIEAYKREKQNNLKEDIDMYLEKIEKASNPILKQQLISKVRFLYSKLEGNTDPSFNIEDLLKRLDNESKLNKLSSGNRYAFGF